MMKHAPRFYLPAALVVLSLLVALPFLCAACGGTDEMDDPDEPETTSTTQAAEPAEVKVAISDLERLKPAAPKTDLLAAARSFQAFGVDLYSILATDAGDGNLVFSPSSIVTALAMTYAGAAGVTAEEMAATLHFSLEGDALHQAFNALDATLESRSWERKNADGEEEGVLVKTANSLWGQKDLTFERLFLDTLAANYGAGMRLVDYRTTAEEARLAINQWVADQTNHKIPELIPQGVLDTLTRLVLVNAVYLDATWQWQFDLEATRDGQFTTLAGSSVTTPMMSQKEWFAYADGDGWQAVELPYVGNELTMTLIVPDEGRFAEIEGQLATGLVDDVTSALDSDSETSPALAEVSLTMPKFEFRTQAGLSDALAALGMKSAFSLGTADFSGMTTEEPLYISDVIHEAYIAVDEEGTEAAAATAVVMRAGAAMPTDLVELTIDRPFMFALRDKETGGLMFLGRVTDPTR